MLLNWIRIVSQTLLFSEITKTQSFYLQDLIIYYHKMKYTQLMKINEFWFYKAAVEILKVIHSFFFQVPLFLVIICFFV